MEKRLDKILIKILLGICGVCVLCASYAIPNIEGIQIYHKNMHLSEEHKQKLAADIYRFQNADNLWDELRYEFKLPHYENNFRVREQIDWFVNHPDFLINSINRSAPYLYYISQQVRKRHLPAELVLLPIMESSYNPFASSNMGAAGIWQMMPGTATGFGVKRNVWYDGRRDVLASTRAALDYLSYLGNFFDGNWMLAIAAYDTGEGNILSAIRKNIQAGINTDYWSLPVAQETRIYIPRLLALATIISHPTRYNFRLPVIQNAPYLAQVDIGSQIELKHAALLAGLSLEKLKSLNPGYSREKMDPKGPFKMVLPIEHVERFTRNLAHSSIFKQINWTHYKIRSGDTLYSIARRFNTTPDKLRKANPKLALNMKPGKHILIPHITPELSKKILETEQVYLSSSEDISYKHPRVVTPKHTSPTKLIAKALEHFKGKYQLKPGDTLYMVRKGDDLKKIANRFHMTPNTILAVNNIKNHKQIHSGQKLMIPTHLAKAPSSHKKELSPGDTIYMVRKGDNIEKIAKKFRTTPREIRINNLLTSNDIQEGDHLIIPTHLG